VTNADESGYSIELLAAARVSSSECQWMLRLIKTDYASAGKSDVGERVFAYPRNFVLGFVSMS
jgi:hypothetical protein